MIIDYFEIAASSALRPPRNDIFQYIPRLRLDMTAYRYLSISGVIVGSEKGRVLIVKNQAY